VIIGSLAALLVVFGVVGVLFFLPKPAPQDLVSSPPPATPTPEPTFNAELLNSPLTVLVIGTDSSEGRRNRGKGTNTDSMMVAAVNAEHTRITLVSVPRDTVDVPLADGTTWTGKLNGLEAAQDVDALVGAIETLLDIKLDGYVQIDMDGYQSLVKAVDGVRVNVKEPLVDAHLDLNLQAGRQVLNEHNALGYVRERYSTNDFKRAARQQEVLVELVQRLVSSKSDTEIADLLGGLEFLETDLPITELPTLVEIAHRSRDAKVRNIVFQPPEFYTVVTSPVYILEPNIDAMREAVSFLR
jgi:LCP family protein required for cell wall assembly